MKIYVVHGYSAAPHDHWFPWLAEKLRAEGHVVEVVPMPDSTNPSRDAWERTLDERVGDVDEETLLVTHSLGTVTALRWLAARPAPWRLRGLVAVSGFQGPIAAVPELDDYLAEPLDPADVARVCEAIDDRVGIYSDDDSIVPPEASKALAAQLGARTREVPGGGHFLADEGFTELAEVLEAVEDLTR